MYEGQISKELLKKLPKSDLHLHLDGSLRLSTLIELAEADPTIQLPATTESGLRETVFKDRYNDLGEYLQGFAYTCAVLQNATNLTRVARELAEDNLEEGVRYIEVRYAPQLHINEHLSLEQCLVAVDCGLRQAADRFNARPEVVAGLEPRFAYGIIACALRMFNEHTPGWYGRFYRMFSQHRDKEIFSLASQELVRGVVEVRDRCGIPIVGFDLAGQEEGYPARDHQLAFQYAHAHFLHKTVHAGEAYGPLSIFDALTNLYADRIGHGYKLFTTENLDEDGPLNPEQFQQQLLNIIADRRIAVEVCLSSNLQTNPSIENIKQHKLKDMLENRLSIVLCTDNRLISNTSVTDEYWLACSNFNISLKQLRDMVTYGFKRSFFPGKYSEKRAYVRSVLTHFDRTLEEFNIRSDGLSR